ncbi:MAG: hypothetical protein Q9211_007178, partial [Gyalolechia sp. 1 TL-2023]
MSPIHDPEKALQALAAEEDNMKASRLKEKIRHSLMSEKPIHSEQSSRQPSLDEKIRHSMISEKPIPSGQSTRRPSLDDPTALPPLQGPSAAESASARPEPPQPRPTFLQRSRIYGAAEVSTAHADILFIWCCIISGLVDSTIYNAFGTFVSMQTGNTIFLGLGGATPHSTSKPYGWAKSFASIVCFCLGCLVFSHMTRIFGKLRRGTLVASFLAQTLIICVAAAVVQGGSVNGSLDTITDDIDWHTI